MNTTDLLLLVLECAVIAMLIAVPTIMVVTAYRVTKKIGKTLFTTKRRLVKRH